MEERVVMIRPIASQAEVTSKITELYGLRVDRIKQLDGYDDLNFYVECSSPTEDNNVNRCVCKVLNANDSQKPDFIESQHRLMVYLGENGISVPKPIANKHDKYFSLETFGQHEHVFRLLEFVPGKRLNDAQPSPELYRNVGDLIGKIYIRLKDYKDEVLKERKVLWNLESVPKLHSYVHAVTDKQRQDMLTAIINQFQDRVQSAMPQMESGVIHGDLNEHNILVDGTDIAGVIDFGDMNYAPALFEVAISLTYMLIHAKDVSIGKHFLEGYQKHRKLTKLEVDLLKVCVSARAAQSLTLGCFSALEAPNNDYILSSQKNGWTILHQLAELSDSQLRTLWGLPDGSG